jgi:DNA-binding NarL/FixJ family response regulator
MIQYFGCGDCIAFLEFTERETEVLGFLAAGRDNAGVGRRLG